MINKFITRARSIHSLVCVGLDSDFDWIPERFRKSSFPQFEFNRYLIEQTNKFSSAYKFNTAFYEARGSAGIDDLQRTMEYLKINYPEIYTIGDAKRADIGNTNACTVTFLFDLLGFDAVTLNPYLGKEALYPFLLRSNKSSIVLCRTSNSGSEEFQNLLIGETPLWRIVAEKVIHQWNTQNNCMLVVGANCHSELKIIREISGDMTILIPGIGKQGGNLQKVIKNGLNNHGEGLIINSGRDIIFSDNPYIKVKQLHDDINKYR